MPGACEASGDCLRTVRGLLERGAHQLGLCYHPTPALPITESVGALVGSCGVAWMPLG